MERWLSLTVLPSCPSDARPAGPRVHISVPKHTVRQAVRRNRIKRVLREAVRRDPYFDRQGVYCLRVRRLPKEIGLSSAQKVLEALHD